MSDEAVLHAENTIMLYSRYLREIPTATVPRQWAETLLAALQDMLDAHAELCVSMEDPGEESDDYPDEYLAIADDDGWPPEDIEPYETDDQSTIH